MDNEKNLKLEAALRSKEGEFPSDAGTRARNRTVMLTPEITGQMRARLAQDVDSGQPLGLPESSHGGFEAPRSPASGGFQAPGGAHGFGHGAIPMAERTSHEGGGEFAAPYHGAGRAPPASSPGAPRQPNPPPHAIPAHGGIVWAKETKLIGFLVSYDRAPNGEAYDLRTGRIMVTSQGSEPNSLVIQDDSVSPMHAVMRISPEGEIQVLDQLSEYGTRIQRFGSGEEEQLSGEKSTVKHGDVIKFGERTFHVCLVANTDRGE